ncbi:transporter substrate-binding domain-containing protein [Streptosporangium sp. NPDC050855]|uniref:transporter substrate-binding domain-containing protein n=1 Tax=Streptosporangium sp. NPDC050855 TaxID=3366194 RepID=UPI0037BD8076
MTPDGRSPAARSPIQSGSAGSEGSYAGFDIDVATYVAAALGVPETGLTFVPVSATTREKALVDGSVDLVPAAYPITETTERSVTFAGPYITTHTDLLVRSTSKDVKAVADLEGRKVCVTDPALMAVSDGPAWSKADSASDCLTQALDGKTDTFAANESEPAGYAGQNPGKLRLLGAALAPVSFGIALPRNDVGAPRVTAIVKNMIADGTWAKSLARNLPQLTRTGPPPLPDSRATWTTT